LASLGLGLSDAHTAHRLTFAGKGVRPCPFSLACPVASVSSASRGSRGKRPL